MNALEILRKNHPREASQEWEEVRNQITSDPEIMDGLPVFKGTRVPVYIVLDYLAEGLGLEGVLKDYPSLSREKIQAALKFAHLLSSMH